jgi:hypothetical protein
VWDPVTGEIVSEAKNVRYQQKKRQQQEAATQEPVLGMAATAHAGEPGELYSLIGVKSAV